MARIKRKYTVHQYTCNDLNRALDDIRKGISIRKAAKTYKIPKSTLHAKLSGKVPEHCKKGPKPILNSEEEDRLKQWILNKARLGFPMHPNEVKNAVQKVLNEASRRTIFTDNRPGNKWQQLFLKRHPEIAKRNTEMISKGRASVTEENLREWMRELKSYLEENGLNSILERPKSIFNGDETGIQLSPKSGHLLGPRNDKDFYEISSGKEKESLTVLCTFSAAGDALPPMIMYPYKRIPAHISDSVPENWPIGRSNTGWMISSTFYEYIANSFYPWCISNGVEFPVIYFLDGHKSHLTLELSDFCIEHNIILYSLYPNSTHITQPCDVAIFKSLKIKWKQVVQNYKQTTQKAITKASFAPLFKTAFDGLSDSSIKNGFRVCGLYPFDENAVNYQKCISTRRRELYPTHSVENSSLTQDDYISTKKFFDHFIGKEKLELFINIRNRNEVCNDPMYMSWKTCIDQLDDRSIDNDVHNIEQTPNFPVANEGDMDVIIPVVNTEKVRGDEVHDEESSLLNISDIPIIDICDIISHCAANETLISLSDCNKENTIEDGNNKNTISKINEIHTITDENCTVSGEALNVSTKIINEDVNESKRPRLQSTSDVRDIWGKHLLWPSTESGKKATKEKEKLPFAITCSKWRAHQQQIKEEKAQKELQIKERIIQRKIKQEENMIRKQQLKIERERKQEEKAKMREEKAKVQKENTEKKIKAKERQLKLKEEKAKRMKKNVNTFRKPLLIMQEAMILSEEDGTNTIPLDLTI